MDMHSVVMKDVGVHGGGLRAMQVRNVDVPGVRLHKK
jgi:hypothetical protein